MESTVGMERDVVRDPDEWSDMEWSLFTETLGRLKAAGFLDDRGFELLLEMDRWHTAQAEQ